MLSTIQDKDVLREEQLDRIFHALADRTRRTLLAGLAENGPSMVTELAEPFSMSLPAVSRHIKVLETADLVSRSVDGRVHKCSLDAEPLKEVEHWLKFYRDFWSDNLDQLARYVEEKDDQG